MAIPLALGWTLLARGASAVTVGVTVDPNANRHPINPLIYGVNFADPSRLSVVPYTVNRWGGNSTTRYNWKTDVHNTASDWFYMNVTNDAPVAVDPLKLPNGSSADQFLAGSIAGGSKPLLTVPLIGWTPRNGTDPTDARQKRWGFTIGDAFGHPGYGPQGNNECAATGGAFWCTADAGDGTCTPGSRPNCPSGFVTGNLPSDTSDAITPTFVTDWMAHIATTRGSSAATLYALDNEPGIWEGTHRDVHPQKPTYDELWGKSVAMAAAMKAQNPAVKITGPVEDGWCRYMTSAADDCNYWSGADYVAHGSVPWIPWYLDQMKAYEQAHGVRLLDYLDVHYYPQGSCVDGLGWDCRPFDATDPGSGGDETASVAAARLRALKELYDSTWHSEDWIGVDMNVILDLVPRLKGWATDHYPGTKVAITEYRWGNDDGASAALAQAEALAIYGREGVDLATRWVAPAKDTATEDAFRFFLDYDTATAGFQQIVGDSVQATSGAPDTIGSYAVRGPANQLWLLLFNHDPASTNVASATFAVPVTGPATIYTFDPAAGTGARLVKQASTVALGSGGTTLALSLPPRTAAIAIVTVPAGLPFADGFEYGWGAWLHH
jgi:hypothetical protein